MVLADTIVVPANDGMHYTPFVFIGRIESPSAKNAYSYGRIRLNLWMYDHLQTWRIELTVKRKAVCRPIFSNFNKRGNIAWSKAMRNQLIHGCIQGNVYKNDTMQE